MNGDLLIVGGYGVVGRRVAALLAPDYPGRVVIAGRRLDSAEATCSQIGSGAKARRVDVDSRESVETALDGVEVVVSCVDQRKPYLVQTCARNGLAWTPTSRVCNRPRKKGMSRYRTTADTTGPSQFGMSA